MQNHFTEKESKRIDEIDLKLAKLRNTFEAFLPIFHQLDRKVKGLDLEIKILLEEKNKITHGQLLFDLPF